MSSELIPAALAAARVRLAFDAGTVAVVEMVRAVVALDRADVPALDAVELGAELDARVAEIARRVGVPVNFDAVATPDDLTAAVTLGLHQLVATAAGALERVTPPGAVL